MDAQNRFLLIDKPKGITSFDVIRLLRKKLGIFKMGHAGTLDPFATGLLVVASGAHTTQLAGLIGLDKEYEATILLGVTTSTGDPDGEIVEKKEVGEISAEILKNILQGMVGGIELAVPRYSAIKKAGIALYKLARRGVDFEPPVKTMKVLSADFLGSERGVGNTLIVKARFSVGSGTYIRSLAEEFGRRLKLPASLKELRRTRVGKYRVEQAETI